MIKSTVAFKTMLLCLLPLLVKGFNSSLSFEPIILSGGKVNQVQGLTEVPYRIKTIVIDAGHGGKDPGCSGAHSREKHIALAVALKLAKSIRAKFPDIQVILTRDKDVFIPLYERAAIANRASADLFISIHCNFLPGSSATRGTETYVMGLHTAEHNLKVAKRENEAIFLEDDYEKHYDYDLNSPEGHIMLSMFQNAYLEQSILLAEKFEAHAAKTANRRSRGVKQAGFVVLKETAMPSILAEIGFLSNYREEAFLKSGGGQNEMVNALTLAFAEYKQIIENEAFTVGTSNNMIASIPLDGKQIDSQPRTPQEPLIRIDREKKTNSALQQKAVPYPAPEISPKPKASSPPPTAAPKQVILRSHYDNGSDVTPAQPPSTTTTRTVSKREPLIVPTTRTKTATPKRATIPDRKIETQPTPNHSGLQFCVQLAASAKPLNTKHPQWANVTYPIEVVKEGQHYKYQARGFLNLQDANKARLRLKHEGFMDAFIAIYREGIRLSPTETKEIMAAETRGINRP